MSFDVRSVAEVFPPGEFIKEELEARAWTQEDLAEIIGRQPSIVSGLVNGKKAVSPAIAADLAEAFGTSAQLWMNLESAYQLHSESRSDRAVARKARLYEKVPVKEIAKRGWIEPSDDVGLLEDRVLKFMEISSVKEDPKLAYAAKRSTAIANPSQLAWVCRAKKIARGIQANPFSTHRFHDALAKLKQLRSNPEDLRHIPRVLAEGGVRFVLIESLPKGKIDGACFWLDESSPVIAISMRYDRIDHFWYVASHEFGHVENKDALGGQPILDVDLVGEQCVHFEDKSDIEKRADLFAESFLVDKRELGNFIARVRPLYSKQKIKNFAARIGVHPAIVLGQLQHRKEVDWSHSREMLVRVRDILMSSALTDGWGHVITVKL